MTTFIYALIDPLTQLVRYVGKSNHPRIRLAQHVTESRRLGTHRNCWINSLVELGLRPILEVIEEVPTELWEMCERRHIAWFRNEGYDITNATDGGDGAQKGRKLSPQHSAKISAANKGRIITEEHRMKLSASLKGRLISDRARECISKANRGRRRTNEFRAACRARFSGEGNPRFGAVVSPETRAKISAANSGEKHPKWGRKDSPATVEKKRQAALLRPVKNKNWVILEVN